MDAKKILEIGKHEIDISWISVERTLKAMDKYNSIISLENKTDSNVIGTMVEAVVILIHKDYIKYDDFEGTFKEWLNFRKEWKIRESITAEYILKHLDYKELSDFMEVALEPILGDKKKVIKGQQAVETVAEKLAEMDPEVLKQLLQSAVVSTDGKESTSIND